RGVHANDLSVQLTSEHVHDHVAFVQAQQTVVHKHASQLVTNGAVDQRSSDGRIHTAGQAQDDFFVTHLFANLGYSFFDVVAHDPVRLCAADVQYKTVEHGCALHRVRDFRVELHSVEAACFVG